MGTKYMYCWICFLINKLLIKKNDILFIHKTEIYNNNNSHGHIINRRFGIHYWNDS